MKKITEPMQKVAVDILVELSFVQNGEQFDEVYEKMFRKYGLHHDPFTDLPCTNKEYEQSAKEYYKQKMIEIFGYWE